MMRKSLQGNLSFILAQRTWVHIQHASYHFFSIIPYQLRLAHSSPSPPSLPFSYTRSFFLAKTLLLRSNTGNGHGIPTAAQPVRIAKYHPDTNPIMPNPPPILKSINMCSRSASVVADAIEKSAAAMKEKSITSPKKVRVKSRFTRIVQIRKTKETRVLLAGRAN